MATLQSKSEIHDLPDHWEERRDIRTGLPFFLNHTDKSTTWDDPRLAQPKGMINPILRPSSPARQNKPQAFNDFFRPSFDDDFFKQGFGQSTLPRGRRGFGPRFVDMDQWFHSSEANNEPDDIPAQPIFSTLGRRNHRAKSKPQQYEPPTQTRSRVGYSEPPCEERLYGRPNLDFDIPVEIHSRDIADQARTAPSRFSAQRSPIHYQHQSYNPTFTRRMSAQEPPSQTHSKFLASKLSEPTILHQRPVSPNYRENSPVHEESFEPVSGGESDGESTSGLESRISVEEHPTDDQSAEYVPDDVSPDQHKENKLGSETANNDHFEQSDEISPEKQAEHHKQIQEALDKIRRIRGQVDEYKLQISDFEGGRCSKDYRYLSEMLTRATLSLDTIDSLGEADIRVKRKEVIKYVDLCTDQLERKCQ